MTIQVQLLGSTSIKPSPVNLYLTYRKIKILCLKPCVFSRVSKTTASLPRPNYLALRAATNRWAQSSELIGSFLRQARGDAIAAGVIRHQSDRIGIKSAKELTIKLATVCGETTSSYVQSYRGEDLS